MILARGVVVKVGGSLMDVAESVMRVLSQSPVPVLIVPGGGVFANGIRDLGVDGTAAHWMAVSAMDQYGWFLSTFGVAVDDVCSMPLAGAKILLPYRVLRDADPLPHSWDVTSDTISAWIAGKLGCPLILLKSVDGVFLGGDLLEEISADIETDVIDPCCRGVLRRYAVPAHIINGRCPDRLSAYLQGDCVPGTRL
ncbi:MAG TPA: uridylate kinase [Methanocorpusculum sp.]|nr:uridylate kinase [Methanocorpusculum sp.]HJK67659.1 uridylate kinase [Methanocorpusculum sp.]